MRINTLNQCHDVLYTQKKNKYISGDLKHGLSKKWNAMSYNEIEKTPLPKRS